MLKEVNSEEFKELAGKGVRVRKISFPDYGQPSSALAKMYCL